MPNLITSNPGFESGTNTSSLYNATAVLDTGTVHSGTQSLKVTYSSGGYWAGVTLASGLNSAKTYRFTYWYFTPSGGAHVTGQNGSAYGDSSTVVGQWAQGSVVFTGQTSLAPIIFQSGGATGITYLDDLYLDEWTPALPNLFQYDPGFDYGLNLLTNSPAGSHAFNCVPSQELTIVHTGPYSCKLAWQTSASAYAAMAGVASGLSAGVVYQASAWVYVPTGGRAVYLNLQSLGLNSAVSTKHDQWEKLTVNFTGATASNFLIAASGGPTTGEVTYIDDLSIAPYVAPHQGWGVAA